MPRFGLYGISSLTSLLFPKLRWRGVEPVPCVKEGSNVTNSMFKNIVNFKPSFSICLYIACVLVAIGTGQQLETQFKWKHLQIFFFFFFTKYLGRARFFYWMIFEARLFFFLNTLLSQLIFYLAYPKPGLFSPKYTRPHPQKIKWSTPK